MSSAERGPVCGGKTKVDLDQSNSLEYDKLAGWAVEEHNKRQNSQEGLLTFGTLLGAETQVVAGVMVHLHLDAKNKEGETQVYKASVWEKPWEQFKQLTAFDPVGEA